MQRTLKNRTIFCRDNLEVLRGIDSATIDLIYLDPPFNKNKRFTASVGTTAEGASFKDIFRQEDVKDEWIDIIAEKNAPLAEYLDGIERIGYRYNKYYLVYMAIRLLEIKRILKESGSVYLHCDQTMNHYLKLLMDCIFGEDNFRNEIIWRIGWVSGYKTQKKGWIRNHETLLYYVKTTKATALFNKEYIPYPEGYTRRDGSAPTGKGFPIEDTWNCHGGDVLDSIMIKSFSTEKTGYPTQKPRALLERIINASSNEGDVVLDPFCGCATTCIAAEKLHRQWIGIDISKQAYHLVRERIAQEIDKQALFNGADKTEEKKPSKTPQPIYRDDIPARTDVPQEINLKNPTHKQSIKKYFYGEQVGICAGCGLHFQIQNLTIEHKVPQVKGGGDNLENLMLLCGNCNSTKGDKDLPYLMKRLKEKGIIKVL